ncbi:MAG: KilA-N domain-containing protein [Sphaerospermopsis kisseleviana]
MSGKKVALERILNGEVVYQNQITGYVNATQISKIHRNLTGERRDPNDVLKTDIAQRAIRKLSEVTGIPENEIVIALGDRSGIKSYVGKLPDSDSVRLPAKEYADIFLFL